MSRKAKVITYAVAASLLCAIWMGPVAILVGIGILITDFRS